MSCASDDYTVCGNTEPDVAGYPVKVRLSLSAAPTGGTRASSGLIPDYENFIWDVWVVQYSANGILLSGGTRHYRGNVDVGTLQVTDADMTADNGTQGVTLMSGQSTVCIVANMYPREMSPTVNWPDNLEAFKRMKVDVEEKLQQAAAGTLEQMPMCGYWTGNVEQGTMLSTELGRMFVKVRVTLTNGTGEDLTGVDVSLTNVPKKISLFPDVQGDPLGADCYTDALAGDRIETLAAKGDGRTASLYYYMAPNTCNDAEYATTLNVSTGEGIKGSLLLGNNPPSEAERNYSLYANSIYLFGITLNK